MWTKSMEAVITTGKIAPNALGRELVKSKRNTNCLNSNSSLTVDLSLPLLQSIIWTKQSIPASSITKITPIINFRIWTTCKIIRILELRLTSRLSILMEEVFLPKETNHCHLLAMLETNPCKCTTTILMLRDQVSEIWITSRWISSLKANIISPMKAIMFNQECLKSTKWMEVLVPRDNRLIINWAGTFLILWSMGPQIRTKDRTCTLNTRCLLTLTMDHQDRCLRQSTSSSNTKKTFQQLVCP